MKCSTAQVWLSAHVDGELGPLRGWALARHLRGCGACASELARLGDLRARLQAGLPRHGASAQLRERVLAALPVPLAAGPVRIAPRPPAGRPGWQWLAGGALAGSLATVLVFLAGSYALDRLGAGDLMAEAVRIHVQAGLADRRIEVASSDRHTVKPWLSARLDFSPPVNDLKDEGFELAGGRIEVLRGRRVAILVYRHRLHFIDVFVQPLPSGAPAHSGSLRGFHLAHAMGDGMDFLAVSDVDAAVLQDFVARLAARPAPR